MLNRFAVGFLFAVGISAGAAAPLLAAKLSEETFEKLKLLIQPQQGEGRWRDVDWQTDLNAARRQAAEQGKPLLIWAGGGSAPLGGC